MRGIILYLISNNTCLSSLLLSINLMRRLVLCPYVTLSFIPIRLIISIINNTPERYNCVRLTDTGVLILIYSNYVVKIPLGPIPQKDLIKNMNQYNLIKSSSYREHVSYWLEDHGTHYKMELLLEGNNKPALVRRYFETLSKTGRGTIMSIKDLSELILLGKRKLSDITDLDLAFDKEKKYTVSIMHGDLTPKNIMTNISGVPLLIDLNRFKFKGFEFIDLIHFEVEFESKRLCKNYFDYIILKFDMLKKIFGVEKLKIYVLYRIGSEHNNGIKNERWYYDGMRLIAQKLSS